MNYIILVAGAGTFKFQNVLQKQKNLLNILQLIQKFWKQKNAGLSILYRIMKIS